MKVPCYVCGKIINRYPAVLKVHPKPACNKACQNQIRHLDAAPIGTRHTTTEGYVWIKTGANNRSGGWEREHRVVMSDKLGRTLDSKELVHHKNEVKSDNADDNLDVLSPAEHMLNHGVCSAGGIASNIQQARVRSIVKGA